MSQYLFDTKRTRCPYCGSSDGFAQLLNPATKVVVGDSYGKCHSCSVFKTSSEAGYITDGGELVAGGGVVQAKFYQVAKVESFGLKVGSGSLVDFAQSLFGERAVFIAEKMLVCGDHYGNTSFLYADVNGRGMSVKTIAYGNDGKRCKTGLLAGAKTLETSQIAGYISSEGSIRPIRVSDGSYQFLYGQHRIADNNLPVVVVESEKTAFLCSVATDDALFLAAGGSKGLSANKVKALRKAGAISDTLVSRLADRHVIVCFDYDDSGEQGAVSAREALVELGLNNVSVCNMSDLLSTLSISFPPEQHHHSDLADIVAWAMCYGRMFVDIDLVFRHLLRSGSKDAIVERALAEQELMTITKNDYIKEPPKPSLTFTDLSTGNPSQLAIPGNIVMLLASPGVGKSSIVSALVARHINSSTDAFGLDIHAPGGIVVIDTEQSKDQVVILHRRLAKRIGYAAEEMPEILHDRNVNWFVTNKKLTVERQIENLFAAVDLYNPSFVIIDQVGSLVKSVNKEDETSALIKRIATDAETNSRTWVVVLHTNPTSDKGRGVLGSDIHRWAASVLFVRKPNEAGEPSLLTTNNADGTMAKIRAGAPVRCFFAWDKERGDFYPTQKTEQPQVEYPMLVSAVEEIYNTNGVNQPLSFGDLRKKIKELFGASDGTKIFNYLINEDLLKRQPNGKLWPDYDKLRAAKPTPKN
jgi:hypothetical protein